MTSERAGQLYDQYEDAVLEGDQRRAHELYELLIYEED